MQRNDGNDLAVDAMNIVNRMIDGVLIDEQTRLRLRDETGLQTLLVQLRVARLQAYMVTVHGVADIIAALNDLIAGVEELQRQ